MPHTMSLPVFMIAALGFNLVNALMMPAMLQGAKFGERSVIGPLVLELYLKGAVTSENKETD